MNRLLHSKKFRKNLYKWIGMYVVAMSLFTTVVTYSKYISSLEVNDKARTTKFHLDIQATNESEILNHKNDVVCPVNVGDECINNPIPLFGTKTFTFKINTKDLETSADVFFTALIEDNDLKKYFKIARIECSDIRFKVSGDYSVLAEKIIPDKPIVDAIITVTVRAINMPDSSNADLTAKLSQAIKVGYSAIQN